MEKQETSTSNNLESRIKPQKELLEFQLFSRVDTEKTVTNILLYGPSSEQREKQARTLSQKLELDFRKVTLSSLYEEGNTEVALNKILLSTKEKPSLIFFEQAETIFTTYRQNFHSEIFSTVVDSIQEGVINRHTAGQSKMTLSSLIGQEEPSKPVSEQKKLFLLTVFSTNRPVLIPKAITDRVGIPIYVPSPGKEERIEIIKEEIEKFSKIKDRYSPELFELLADLSIGCSYNVITKFIELVFQKSEWKEVTYPSKEDFLELRNLLKSDDFLGMEHFKFAQDFGQTLSFEKVQPNEETDTQFSVLDQLEVSQYLGKRQNKFGRWEIKVKFKNQWVPKAFCPKMTKEEFEDMKDLTNAQHLKELECARELQILSLSDFNTQVDSFMQKSDMIFTSSPEVESSKQEKKKETLSFDMDIFKQPPSTTSETRSSRKKRKAFKLEENDGTDYIERFKQENEDELENLEGEDGKKKRVRKPRKLSLDTPTVTVTQPHSTERRVKWYTSYKGALAYAILKGKTWGLKKDGFLDVRLESDKKKFGGSVYDWDILWLGMKLIPDLVINSNDGVNSTRKMIKNHDSIRDHLTEWRKTRTYEDEKLKKIFGLSKVFTEVELDQFMKENKTWTDDDEKKLFEECLARAKSLQLEDDMKSRRNEY